MKIGDLVKHSEKTQTIALHLNSWLGIILDFDEDNDPVVQWYDGGLQCYPAGAEYRSEVQVI